MTSSSHLLFTAKSVGPVGSKGFPVMAASSLCLSSSARRSASCLSFSSARSRLIFSSSRRSSAVSSSSSSDSSLLIKTRDVSDYGKPGMRSKQSHTYHLRLHLPPPRQNHPYPSHWLPAVFGAWPPRPPRPLITSRTRKLLACVAL